LVYWKLLDLGNSDTINQVSNAKNEGDSMYTIGQFANLSKVSTRMLRHYDKIGLLKPSYTEKNGYRYYCDEDMYKISAIKQLRRYEFSLEEIDKIICKNDVAYTKQKLQLKIDQLRQSTTESQFLIVEMGNQVKAIKGDDMILNAGRNLDILIGQRSALLALCQRKQTSEEAIDDMIDELYEVIAKSRELAPQGTHMTIFHQSYNAYNPDETDIEVCIPVNLAYQQEVYYTRTIEGGLCISTTFIGSYDMIGNAYVALFNWADQNNYLIAGPTTERYFKDKRDTNFQDQYITEICIPVHHKQQK
jgi:DNA-binding transcriptional MerR regulator